VANRPPERQWTVRLEYEFDRLLAEKLAQAYAALVPDRRGTIRSCSTMKTAALYARVSSDRQKENHTISSQLAALVEYAGSYGYLIPPEWRFQDEGYSGVTMLRPGLEALRDLAAAG
jgi:hypothetical protein